LASNYREIAEKHNCFRVVEVGYVGEEKSKKQKTNKKMATKTSAMVTVKDLLFTNEEICQVFFKKCPIPASVGEDGVSKKAKPETILLFYFFYTFKTTSSPIGYYNSSVVEVLCCR